MKILVCIKQVPDEEVKMDWETGTLIRSGGIARLNPYDRFPTEMALYLKDLVGAEVSAITMGPPSAEAVLREVFSLGVDKGVLLTDAAFAGADVFATSYTLAQGIKLLGDFDLILLGQQSTDGDTAQVAPSLASWLGLPFVSWVKEVSLEKENNFLVKSTISSGFAWINIKAPCVLSVEEGINTPRTANIQGKMSARKKEITTLGLSDLEDKDKKNYGIIASPTQVVKVYPPKITGKSTPKEIEAKIIVDIIKSEIGKVGLPNV